MQSAASRPLFELAEPMIEIRCNVTPTIHQLSDPRIGFETWTCELKGYDLRKIGNNSVVYYEKWIIRIRLPSVFDTSVSVRGEIAILHSIPYQTPVVVLSISQISIKRSRRGA